MSSLICAHPVLFGLGCAALGAIVRVGGLICWVAWEEAQAEKTRSRIRAL